MKVYDTKEKEVILEPSFKFAGNPNIIVAVKAFGMKATVQVSLLMKAFYWDSNGSLQSAEILDSDNERNWICSW